MAHQRRDQEAGFESEAARRHSSRPLTLNQRRRLRAALAKLDAARAARFGQLAPEPRPSILGRLRVALQSSRSLIGGRLRGLHA